MRLKELSVERGDRIVSRHRFGEEYQKMSVVLKVPKNTVASIILKWEKFGTTKTLPRAGRLAKPSNRGEGPWSGRLPRTKCSLWQSSSVLLWRWENLPEGQPSGLYGRVARRKPLLSKCHMTARLEFAKRHLKDSQTLRNKILWSYDTKFELFGLNVKLYVTRNPGTTLMWSIVVAASCCGDVF
jgi:hypothetical protein